MIEISGELFKEYVTTNRAAKFNGSFILEAKVGKIGLNFSFVKNKSEIMLVFRKISGNGKVLLGDSLVSVLGKNSQVFSIGQVDSIQITRPKDSLGEISLDKIIIEQENMVNWKRLLDNCGPFTSLRMIGNKLFASEGATIAYGVKSIRTNPENLAVFEDSKIIFLGSCEIVSLETDPNLGKPKEDPFPHREGPTPQIPQELQQELIKPERKPLISVATEPKNKPDLPDIIYDSDAIHGLSKGNFYFNNKLLKIISSNGQDYLLIKKNGIFTLPISRLEPGKEYFISLICKKLNGNGKIKTGFCYDNNYGNLAPVLADTSFDTKIINFMVPRETYPGETIKLVIAMLDDGMGEVLISKIVVVAASSEFVSREKVLGSYFGIVDRHIPITLSTVDVEDPVKDLTKESAMVFAQSYTIPSTITEKIILEPLTYQSRVWISKIMPLCDNLRIKDSKKLFDRATFTNEDSQLTITKLGKIQPRKRIWLEEWSSKQIPSAGDLEILKQCEVVITPSLINAQLLKQSLPELKIQCLPKLWPTPGFKPMNKNRFFMYFEKNTKVTLMLAQYWKEHFPKLIMVGTNCQVPNFIEKISEYEDYINIITRMSGCAAVIDLNNNTNYSSAIVNFCLSNGINIITNNLAEVVTEPKGMYFLNTPVNPEGNISLDSVIFDRYLNEVRHQDLHFDANQAFKQNLFQLIGAV